MELLDRNLEKGSNYGPPAFRHQRQEIQDAVTCPVETMTGSFINSSDIGQRKSSGITGAL